MKENKNEKDFEVKIPDFDADEINKNTIIIMETGPENVDTRAN
jgi:hypothetical protein